MKRIFVYLILVFAISVFSSQTQEIKYGFKIKKRKNIYNGKIDTYYNDSITNAHYDLPKDNEGKNLSELWGKTLNSIEKLKSIADI